MTKFEQALADMTSIWFAGKVKTAAELRDVIGQLATMPNYREIPANRLEYIARDNEMRQGIKMF
jgi:hypothetical protein